MSLNNAISTRSHGVIHINGSSTPKNIFQRQQDREEKVACFGTVWYT